MTQKDVSINFIIALLTVGLFGLSFFISIPAVLILAPIWIWHGFALVTFWIAVGLIRMTEGPGAIRKFQALVLSLQTEKLKKELKESEND